MLTMRNIDDSFMLGEEKNKKTAVWKEIRPNKTYRQMLGGKDGGVIASLREKVC